MAVLILSPAIHTEVELEDAILTPTMSELLLKVCKFDDISAKRCFVFSGSILVVSMVSSLLYSEGFSPGTPVFPSPLKQNSKARFKRRAIVLHNSVDGVINKFDFSTAVARSLKPSLATAV